MVFFEGRGPVRSLFKRSVLAGLSVLVFIPTGFFGCTYLCYIFWVWFVFFLVTYDVRMTNDERKEECNELCKNTKGCLRTQWGKDIVSCFTIPFLCQSCCSCCDNLCCEKRCCENPCCCIFQLIKGVGGCILIAVVAFIYLILVVFCLIKFIVFDLIFSFILPHPRCSRD